MPRKAMSPVLEAVTRSAQGTELIYERIKTMAMTMRERNVPAGVSKTSVIELYSTGLHRSTLTPNPSPGGRGERRAKPDSCPVSKCQ